MTTLEQVEKLRTMAKISYFEAKTALDETNGDLLEAIIYLEKQGKVNAQSGGCYSNSDCGKNFSSHMRNLGGFCSKLIRKGNTNSFEVLKGEESKASTPVTGFAFMLIIAPWLTIPLIIIGLFFGFRYRFSGPDFSGSSVNDAMNSAADAAVNLKKSIEN